MSSPTSKSQRDRNNNHFLLCRRLSFSAAALIIGLLLSSAVPFAAATTTTEAATTAAIGTVGYPFSCTVQFHDPQSCTSSVETGCSWCHGGNLPGICVSTAQAQIFVGHLPYVDCFMGTAKPTPVPTPAPQGSSSAVSHSSITATAVLLLLSSLSCAG